MPAQTHVALFGVPRVSSSGRELVISVRKTRALLAYLCVEGRSSRERLAGLFWGDLDEATARRNLRRALHRLRSVGLGELLQADDETVALAGVRCDLHDFDAAVRAERWADVQAIYAGPLCDGLELQDAEGFEAWLRERRERAARDWRHAMARHAAALESTGALRAAVDVQQRLLADDPLREAGYRDLMRLHDALDQRSAALDVFDRCVVTLRDELQLEPLPETRLLAERIRARTFAGQAAATAESAGDAASARFELRSVPLVGRDRELAALAACTEAVVLVEGDAGVGKTRLVLAALQRAAQPVDNTAPAAPEPMLHVRFTEMSSLTPFHAVIDALREPAVAARLAGLDAVHRQDLSRWLPHAGADDSAADAAAAALPAQFRARLLEALVQALALAAGPAHALLFDDLQWADASSIELLAQLARRHHQQPAAMPRVLATARSAELADNPLAGTMLHELEAQGRLARLPLAAFDEWSMLQLVQGLSGSGGGVRFAARLRSATGGNIFFALETIRTLFDSGELVVEPGEGWSTRHDPTTTDYAELPLPASVVEAVRARLARLGAATQRLLETAALAEDGSTLAEIQGATALNDWEALEGIERAVAAQFVDRSGSGYRFTHALVRSAICSGLSPERQRLTHAKLAAALEPLHAAPTRIAHHWELAGQASAAARAWVSAAEAAAALHAHHEVIDHYGRAAALASDPAQAFEWHDLRIVRMMVAGLEADRDALLAELLALAERTGSDALMFRALLRAAESAAQMRRFGDCERHVMRALREFQPPDARRHLAAFAIAAFAAAQQLGRADDALARWLEQLEVAQRSEPKAVARAAASAATVAVDLDRMDQARALRETALHALMVIPQTEAIVRGDVLMYASFVTRADGDRAACLDENGQALSIARRLRNRLMEQIVLANRCETLVDDGQHDAAAQAHAACVATFTDTDAPFPRYLIAMIGVPLYLLRGDIGAAVDAARTSIAAADTIDEQADRRDARLMCADVLEQIGAQTDAQRLADEVQALTSLPAGRLLLPLENLRAAAGLQRDPDGVAATLRLALAAPLADRLVHPHIGAARVLIGRCELAAGRPAAARGAVVGLRYSLALESAALVVRLQADTLDGHTDPALLAEALFQLNAGRLPPLYALDLMRAVAVRLPKPEAARLRARMRASAQALADSLRGHPPLQAALIRKHRDLLT